MAEIIVCVFFICWFLLNVIYVFKKELLAQAGSWLHRWGWINEWSMFTGNYSRQETYKLVYADFDQENDEKKWKHLSFDRSSLFGFVLNPNFRFSYFVSKCLKKITVGKRTQHKESYNKEVFDYLCSVLQQLPNKNNNKFRLVKLMKIEDKKHAVDVLVSDHILLR